MPKANELIVQVLEEAGVEYVFGIPGGGTGQIYDLLFGKEDRIKTILVRHEQESSGTRNLTLWDSAASVHQTPPQILRRSAPQDDRLSDRPGNSFRYQRTS